MWTESGRNQQKIIKHLRVSNIEYSTHYWTVKRQKKIQLVDIVEGTMKACVSEAMTSVNATLSTEKTTMDEPGTHIFQPHFSASSQIFYRDILLVRSKLTQTNGNCSPLCTKLRLPGTEKGDGPMQETQDRLEKESSS